MRCQVLTAYSVVRCLRLCGSLQEQRTGSPTTPPLHTRTGPQCLAWKQRTHAGGPENTNTWRYDATALHGRLTRVRGGAVNLKLC
jgi:hypothetical protein